ncbi:MAG: hypothetical protein IPF47_01260 [Gemmatimonadetes bacterium]|nr:hypothetical protein [Gemmatimonadota bacterium]
MPGSGKSNENFISESPRGGMKTSLVDESSTMSPGAYRSRTASGAGTAGVALAPVSIAPALSESSGTRAPALTAPTVLSQSRRENGSVISAWI